MWKFACILSMCKNSGKRLSELKLKRRGHEVRFFVSETTLTKNRIAVSVHVPKVLPHAAIVFDCHYSEGIRRYMAAYSGAAYHTPERLEFLNPVYTSVTRATRMRIFI